MSDAIPFIYRRSRTMADGTLRIEVDVAPVDALNAFTLFNLPDVPGAMVRMTQESAQASCQQQMIREAAWPAIVLTGNESLATLVAEGYDEEYDGDQIWPSIVRSDMGKEPLHPRQESDRYEHKLPSDRLVFDIVMMCKEPAFQEWASIQFGYCVGEVGSSEYVRYAVSEVGSSEYVLEVCNVKSRAEIRTGTEAAKIFHEKIRRPYDAWNSSRDQRKNWKIERDLIEPR